MGRVHRLPDTTRRYAENSIPCFSLYDFGAILLLFLVHTWFYNTIFTIFLRNRGPQGFWGSGENGFLFSGSYGALVIISGDLGRKLIFLGI